MFVRHPSCDCDLFQEARSAIVVLWSEICGMAKLRYVRCMAHGWFCWPLAFTLELFMLDMHKIGMFSKYNAIGEHGLQTHCLSANGYGQNKPTTASTVHLWLNAAARFSDNLLPHHRDFDFAYRPSNDHESSPPSDDLHEERHRDRRIEPQGSR